MRLPRPPRTSRSALRGLLAAALVALAVPTPALGAAELQFRWEFDHLRPAAPATGLFKAGFRQRGDPDAKPPPVTGIVVDTPSGTRLGETGIEHCEAEDLALMLRGPAACPPGSRIGGGGLSVMTGLGPLIDPQMIDVTNFSTPTGFLGVGGPQGGGPTLALDRYRVAGTRISASPPATPGGPPDGRSVLYDLEFRLGPRYVRTPAVCPRGGWVTSARAEFADGSRATTAGRQICTGGGLRVTVRPSRIRTGRSRIVRVAVSTAAGAPAAGASVRVAGRQALTGANGRARLRIRPRRPGRRSVTAAMDGARGSTGLRVLKRRSASRRPSAQLP